MPEVTSVRGTQGHFDARQGKVQCGPESENIEFEAMHMYVEVTTSTHVEFEVTTLLQNGREMKQGNANARMHLRLAPKGSEFFYKNEGETTLNASACRTQ